MPRRSRDERLDTRTARLKLAPRAEPYWRNIQEGRAIGYRRLAGGKAGSWIARHYDPTQTPARRTKPLGSADDYDTADGKDTLTFGQAQEQAREWFADLGRAGGIVAEPVTVREAAADYLADYRARSNKATDQTEQTIQAHILPKFGPRPLAELTTAEILGWRNKLALSSPRRRSPKTGKATRKDNAKAAAALAAERPETDPGEAHRKRQATANRVLTVFKAICNGAFKAGRVTSDLPWRRVPPFKNADQPRVRYLTDDEAKALVGASGADFRALVIGALLTGADYGELRTARVRDLDAVGHSLTVGAKRGSHVLILTDEAVQHFTALATGKPGAALLFMREDGAPWGKSHQDRRLRDACKAANILPAINFHILRHTFATRALRRGAAMQYISHQLGHKNIRTTQRHYAHVIPSDASEAIRQAMGSLGIV